MGNPLIRNNSQLRPGDLLQGLAEIGADMETARQHIEEFERTGKTEAEMAMVIALSGLEIKMTNWTQEIRIKLL